MPALTVIRVAAALAAVIKLFDILPALLSLSDTAAFRAPTSGLLPYPSPAVVWLLAAAWLTACLLLAIGARSRAAAGLLALMTAGVLALDAQLYGNHLYLLGLVLVVWAAAPPDARLPSYRWLLSIMYGFAAAAKLNLVYISGGVLGLELGRGSLLPWPDELRVWWLLAGLAVLALAAEAFLAVGLWVPRHRRGATLVGVALHAGIIAFFEASVPIAVFTLVSLSLYTAFFTAPDADVSADADVGSRGCQRRERTPPRAAFAPSRA